MVLDLSSSTNPNHVRPINQQNLLSLYNRKAPSFCGAPLNQLSNDKFEFSSAQKNNNVVSFGSSFQKPEFTVDAMAPLLIDNDIEMAKFKNDIRYAKEKGVKSISVDVWSGVVQKAGEEKFDWSIYEKMFSVLKQNDMGILVNFSEHPCGGNIGDSVNIPTSEWKWDYLAKQLGVDSIKNDNPEIEKTLKQKFKDDLRYKNEHGDYIADEIPIWYDEIMMPKSRKFMEEFKKHFIDNPNPFINIKDSVKEIHTSCGPAGELRYPTYGENIKGAEFPTRGWFIGYSEGGKAAFRKDMQAKYDNNIAKLNYEWETNLKSFDDILPPHNNAPEMGRATGFVESKDYANTKYGRDFVDFLNNRLLKHGENKVTMTHEIFKDTSIPIAVKYPGIHWQIANKNTPRIAEIVAGLINTDITRENDFGYKPFFDMVKSVKDKFKNSDTIAYFTCLEMKNDLNGVSKGIPTNSCAEFLVDWVSKAAKSRGIVIKGENACEDNLRNEESWNMLKHNAWEGYDGVTFLRVGALKNNMHFENFMNWVKGDLLKKGKELFRMVA